jgi:hypothetical protein
VRRRAEVFVVLWIQQREKALEAVAEEALRTLEAA